ncbi:UDP-N-acetylmuramoyl-L-alanyl-D-glutamate--2,6-diaminopimelate ligase [Clostridiaceae bacterium HSG29]|nr:UDP-N-acetylmuramoyl-L-alanyl-D-glutamate--2,6-diaminopimelate ligase [Clostridiaceae bacterium HSG29]
MNLKKILENVEFELIKGNLDKEILGIESDSRNIKEGYLFVAINGETVDGHKFINNAIDNGASAIIVEQDVDIENEAISIIKSKITDRTLLPIIINNFYDFVSKKLKIIGVTGTNGKSSITKMLSDAINGNGYETCTMGTIRNTVGNKIIESKNTTPGPIELNEILLKAVNEDIKFVVMEVSSHGLAQKRVAGIDYDIGIFTNLTNEHMEFHKNMDDYFNAKAKLFEMAKGNVINYDDEYGKKLIKIYKSQNKPLLTYGLTEESDIYVKNVEYSYEGTKCTLITPKFETDIFINIPGEIYIYNTLSVIGAMALMGYDKEKIVNGINSFKNINGRFDKVETNTDFDVIVDYAHSSDALRKVLTEINKFKKGRLITIFGCTGNRDKHKRPIMGSISEELSDITILTSDDIYDEDPEAIIKDIMKGIKDTNKIYHDADRGSAIKIGIDLAKKNDIILIAGKGHETVIKIGKERIPFNDKNFVLNYLLERKKSDEK